MDLCDLPHIDVKTSIDDLSMFKDGTADLIYASHCLEYFDLEQASSVLKEWRRVLKPGGILRLAVPDFDALLTVYAQTKDIKTILGPLYGRMQIDTENGRLALYHKVAYSYQLLKLTLEDANFKDVRRYDWRETIHKSYDDHSQAYYPHMDKDNGILVSLNVECHK